MSSWARAEDGPSPAAPPEPEGMKKIFNGENLDGWEGDTRLWKVVDGVIRGETTADAQTQGNTFLVWKDGKLEDFELRIKFKIDHGNSGIQYRSELLPAKEDAQNKWVVKGYQAEVENTPGKAGFLYHEKGRAFLNNVGDKVEIGEDGKPKVVGQLGKKDEIAKTYNKSDWNEYVIRCEGNHVQHWLNGFQTVDLTDNDVKGRCMSGILALQIHAGPPMWVEFKDIRLKQLPKSE
jgi:hypothetical protein